MSLEFQVAAVAFAVALPLTAILRLPTRPNRKPGQARIPRIGGFSIVGGFVVAPFVVAAYSSDMREFMRDDWWDVLALALCGGAMFALGAVDDFRPLSWKFKFGAQFAAAIALYIFGYRIEEMTFPGNGTVSLGIVDPVVTVFWIVLITNAMNLIDGYDGVAPGVAAMVSGTMAYVAWDLDHNMIAILFATLAGASLGFVPFNLPNARRLLGDSGAYFLGFTIAGLSVAGFLDSSGRVPLYIPLVALGLPVLDLVVAFARRYLDGRNPFEADQDHFHDRIERVFGLTPLKVTLTAWGITAVFCLGAVLLHAWYKEAGSAVVGGAVIAFAAGLVAVLGYATTMWNSSKVLAWRGRTPEPPRPASAK